MGNWDGQKPVFRGCAGATYAHGNTCRREMQIVEVTPGRPKVSLITPKTYIFHLCLQFLAQVEVEVYLCYCTGDECNKTDIDGAGSQGASVALLATLLLSAGTWSRTHF